MCVNLINWPYKVRLQGLCNNDLKVFGKKSEKKESSISIEGLKTRFWKKGLSIY